jgi:uncharacterized protein
MNALWAAVSGALFGVGLVLSGMTSPAKVIGFLDLTGDFDPSLAFVMGGALCVYAPLYRLIARKQSITLPADQSIDARLLAGSALFGLGWGLSGICPGPGLVALGGFTSKAFVFVLAMIAGALLFRAFQSFTLQRERTEPVTDA